MENKEEQKELQDTMQNAEIKEKDLEQQKQEKRQELLNKSEQRKKDMLKKISFKFKDKKIQIDVKTMVAFRLTKTDNIPVQIFKNIYLGSIGSALCKEQLLKHNITNVLNVSGDATPEYPNGILNYKQVKLNDSIQQVIIPHFEETNQYIQEAIDNNQNILVHCFAGKSRSVTVILAYLMCKQNMTRDEGLDLIRDKRPQASPNYGFMKQLLVYESILQKNKPNQKQEQQQIQQNKQDQINQINQNQDTQKENQQE